MFDDESMLHAALSSKGPTCTINLTLRLEKAVQSGEGRQYKLFYQIINN